MTSTEPVDYRCAFHFRIPKVVSYRAADRRRFSVSLNRYPGVVIGAAVHIGTRVLGIIWGRPDRIIRKTPPTYRHGDWRGARWTLRDRLAALVQADGQRRFCSHCCGWSCGRVTLADHQAHLRTHRVLEHEEYILLHHLREKGGHGNA